MNKLVFAFVLVSLQLTSAVVFAQETASASNLNALAKQVKKLNKRLIKIENLLQNKILIETVDRIDDLQSEIQQVRGDVESIDFKVQSATKRNRNYFIDTDRRINELEIARKNNKVTQVNIIKPIDKPKEVNLVSSIHPKDKKQVKETTKKEIEKKQPDTNKSNVLAKIEIKKPVEPKVVPKVETTKKLAVVINTQSNKLDPNERKDYMAAFNFLKQGRYQKSLNAFTEFLKKHPNGRYADNAQYWLAESNYVSRFFDSAIIEFNKVITLYPSSPKVADAKLKLGYSYYERSMWAKAKNTFKSLIKNYPNTSIASLAKRRLKRLEREGH